MKNRSVVGQFWGKFNTSLYAGMKAEHYSSAVYLLYLIGDPPGRFSLAQRIVNHYLEIGSNVDMFCSYTASGTVHTMLRSDLFYSYEVEGVQFIDWVDALAKGGSVAHVSCVNEANGCNVAPGE